MDFSSDFSKNECNVSQSGLFMTENSVNKNSYAYLLCKVLTGLCYFFLQNTGIIAEVSVYT